MTTKRRYIGRTTHKELRGRQHITALAANRHINKLMQSDYNNNGHEFQYGILEAIPDGKLADAHNREKFYMELFRTYDERFGYNFKDWMNRETRRLYVSRMDEENP